MAEAEWKSFLNVNLLGFHRPCIYDTQKNVLKKFNDKMLELTSRHAPVENS